MQPLMNDHMYPFNTHTHTHTHTQPFASALHWNICHSECYHSMHHQLPPPFCRPPWLPNHVHPGVPPPPSLVCLADLDPGGQYGLPSLHLLWQIYHAVPNLCWLWRSPGHCGNHGHLFPGSGVQLADNYVYPDPAHSYRSVTCVS